MECGSCLDVGLVGMDGATHIIADKHQRGIEQ